MAPEKIDVSGKREGQTPRVVIVEGNISAGKTTLANALGKILGFRVFLEPVTENPYLELFYKDPKRYALPLQMWIIRQRFDTYVEALRFVQDTGRGVILDRSVFGDIVFAQKNAIDGNITAEGFKEYKALRNKLLEKLPLPDVTLFLDVKPEICHDRIHNLRKRECESGIPLPYLIGLDACYRAFVRMMEEAGSKTISVNWSQFGEPSPIAMKIRDTPGLDLGGFDFSGPFLTSALNA